VLLRDVEVSGQQRQGDDQKERHGAYSRSSCDGGRRKLGPSARISVLTLAGIAASKSRTDFQESRIIARAFKVFSCDLETNRCDPYATTLRDWDVFEWRNVWPAYE
jgi:hypothetical protein